VINIGLPNDIFGGIVGTNGLPVITVGLGMNGLPVMAVGLSMNGLPVIRVGLPVMVVGIVGGNPLPAGVL